MARRELTGAALTARQLKKELTRVFPGVKFSVKSEYFSGGNAVNVSWEDGPTKRLVEFYTEKYKNSRFDGMTDSTIAVKIAPELGCEGANYIGVARSLSRAREIAIKKMIAKTGERERSAAFYEERHPEIWPDAYRQMWREYETVRAQAAAAAEAERRQREEAAKKIVPIGPYLEKARREKEERETLRQMKEAIKNMPLENLAALAAAIADGDKKEAYRIFLLNAVEKMTGIE